MARVVLTQRTWQNCLVGLQEEWARKRARRHAQATGLILGHLVFSSDAVLAELLTALNKFVRTQGPYGVDGLFLTLMSAASVRLPDAFAQCSETANMLSKKKLRKPKGGMGIYFTDLSDLNTIVAVQQTVASVDVLPSGNVSSRSASIIDSQSGRAGGVRGRGDLTLFSEGFVDPFRDDLFVGNAIGRAAADPREFGNALFQEGSLANAKQPERNRNALYGATNEGCALFAAAAGAVAGKISDRFLPGSGPGTQGIVTAGVLAICGEFVDEDSEPDDSCPSPTDDPTPPSSEEPITVEAKSAGIIEDPDAAVSLPLPDSDDESNPQTQAAIAFLLAAGLPLDQGITKSGPEGLMQPQPGSEPTEGQPRKVKIRLSMDRGNIDPNPQDSEGGSEHKFGGIGGLRGTLPDPEDITPGDT